MRRILAKAAIILLLLAVAWSVIALLIGVYRGTFHGEVREPEPITRSASDDRGDDGSN